MQVEVLDARRFERLGHEILHKAARGEGGVDILTAKSKGDISETWAVECKWWSSSVGFDVIQKHLGAMTDLKESGEEFVRGMVVTTSSFTKDAERLAARHDITLIDGNRLGALCDAENLRIRN